MPAIPADKLALMKQLGIAPPTIRVRASSGGDCYRPASNTIELSPRLSVVTFLHEFGHAAACSYGGARPGRMGAGIAHAFLLAGARVTVVERDGQAAEAARERIERDLAKSLERGGVDGNLDEWAENLTVSLDHADFADCELVVEAVPEDELRDPLLQAMDEVIVHAPVDDEPAGRRAPLAARAERGPHDAVEGEIEVGVLPDHDRVLAAELEAHALQPFRGGLVDFLARRVRAGERDFRYQRMLDQRCAGIGAESGDDIDDAFGKPRFFDELHELEHRSGRELGRLDDDRVACRERWRELPRGEQER